jgi:hypothetical protein
MAKDCILINVDERHHREANEGIVIVYSNESTTTEDLIMI